MFYQRMVIFFLVKCIKYMGKNVWQQNEIIIFEILFFCLFLTKLR